MYKYTIVTTHRVHVSRLCGVHHEHIDDDDGDVVDVNKEWRSQLDVCYIQNVAAALEWKNTQV